MKPGACCLLKIPLAPIAQARHRQGRGRVYTPNQVRLWKQDARAALLCDKRVQALKLDPLTGPVSLTVVEVFATKLSRLGCWWQPSKPDIDNVTKLVLDTLNGLVYIDDAQVVQLTACKVVAPAGVAGQVLVHVKNEPRCNVPLGLPAPMEDCTSSCWGEDELDLLLNDPTRQRDYLGKKQKA